MQDSPDCEISINILNSLIELYKVANKPLELEQKVLPQYALNKINFDQNTYNHLAKLYLNLRDLDKVVEIYDK